MKSMDFLDKVKEIIEAEGFECEIGRLETLKGRSGVCIREISRRRVSSDYGGECTYSYIYQVIVRDRDPEYAEKTCWLITEKLGCSRVDSANGSYEFDSQEVYTSPQELELKENLYFAWQVRFDAEIRQEMR